MKRAIIEPVLTEKAIRNKETGNKYTFKVDRNSTKGAIKDVIQEMYKVTVVNVNVLMNGVKAKRSMVGKRMAYYRKPTKKAIVTLKTGDSLKFYEGGSK